MFEQTTLPAPEVPEAGSAPADLTIPLLPGRARGGLVLSVRVLPAAYLIVAVNLLLAASRLGRGWWWQDDLNLLAGVARRGPGAGLLFTDYNGHLVPGTWVLAWLFDRVSPLQWWPAAVITLAFVAAIDLSTLALFRRLFGTRPAILVPFAMVCATSLTLTSTLWWAASLQWLPVTLSLSAGLFFHVGHLQTGRIRDAAGAVLSVVLGLAFFEKALTTLLVLALFTVLYGVGGPVWTRPWRAIREHFGYWAAHAAVAGGFLGLYLAKVHLDTGPSSSTGDVLTTIRWMLLDTLLPSLIGGPLKWYTTPATTINAWPHPLPFVALTAWALTVVAIAGSLLLRRGAWRAWTLVAAFLAVSVGLVVRARLGFIGPFIGRDQRYLTDAALMVPLCLALAWLPLRPGVDRSEAEAAAEEEPTPAAPEEPENLFEPAARTRAPAPEALDERRARTTARTTTVRTGYAGEVRVEDLLERAAVTGVQRSAGLLRRLSQDQRLLAAAGAIAVLLMTVGGAFSGERFMANWTLNPTKPYLTNLEKGLADAKGPVNLLPEAVVPDMVMTPTFLEQRRLSHVTLPLAQRPVFPVYARSYSVVDGLGRVRPGVVQGTAAVVATGTNCANSTTSGVVTFPAVQPEWRWVVKLDYLAQHSTAAQVSLGAYPPVPIRLQAGLHTVYVDLLGGASTKLVVSGIDPGTSVCIGKATIGNLTAG